MWNCENLRRGFLQNQICTLNSFWAPRTNGLKFSTENPQIHIRFSKIHVRFSKFHLISFTCQNMGYQLLRTAENERFEIWSEICGVFEINFPKSGPPYGSNLEHGEFKNQNFSMGFFLNKSWVSEFTGKINTIVARSIFDAEKNERIFFYTPVTVLVPNSIMWENWKSLIV